MKKKDLKRIRKLRATTEMIAMAAADVPKRAARYRWPGSDRQYETGIYLRCEIQKGILHAAFFLADHLRMGSRKAAFDLYIDKAEGRFVTYQHETERWLAAKLDRLPWPSWLYWSEGKWISEKDHETIRQYLGGEHGGYLGLLDYQLQVREDELARKHKRETDRWDADLMQTPELPKDWDRWVYKVGIRKNFIFYRYDRKGADHGYCTWCESEVPVRKPRHNREGRCPKCRHKIVYKSLGKFRAVDVSENGLYLFQRCRDGVILRFFCAGVRYRSEKPGQPERFCFEKRRIIYSREGKKLRSYYYGTYKQQYSRWIEGERPYSYFGYSYYDQDEKGPVYGRTMPDLSRRELKNTGLREYLCQRKEAEPDEYLAVLEDRPELERIVKGGLAFLAEEYIKDPWKGRLFRTDETALTRMLGINTMELKRLREKQGGFLFLQWLQQERKTGKILDDAAISWFCAERIGPEALRFIRDRMSETQICHYIKRQMKENGMKSSEVLAVWQDYLSMAVGLGMDRNDPIVYRARKLRQRHDELVERAGDKDLLVRTGKIQESFPQMAQVLRELKGIYEYAGDEYSIIAPAGIAEILQEGRKLHHCVGDSDIYWERMSRRESYILFLRQSAALHEPYYTLEVEPDGTVRQKRTAYDRQGKELAQIEIFLKKWQKELAKRITDREKQLAGKSAALRKENLEDLKKEQVVIRTGELAGKLLAEVLEQDLLEAA